MQRQTIANPSAVTQNAIDSSILRAQEWLLSKQYTERYWWGELESKVAITSEYLLLTHFMGTSKRTSGTVSLHTCAGSKGLTAHGRSAITASAM
ncbi:MAG: hypothetical protein EXR59_03435 [Dehalococcoidia bacterium]|nr:hypothetical protein [Dehalococcoidia bacterium]